MVKYFRGEIFILILILFLPGFTARATLDYEYINKTEIESLTPVVDHFAVGFGHYQDVDTKMHNIFMLRRVGEVWKPMLLQSNDSNTVWYKVLGNITGLDTSKPGTTTTHHFSGRGNLMINVMAKLNSWPTVYISHDAGVNWLVSQPIPYLSQELVSIVINGVIYLPILVNQSNHAQLILYQTTDGINWSDINLPLPSPNFDYYSSVDAFIDGEILYFFANNINYQPVVVKYNLISGELLSTIKICGGQGFTNYDSMSFSVVRSGNELGALFTYFYPTFNFYPFFSKSENLGADWGKCVLTREDLAFTEMPSILGKRGDHFYYSVNNGLAARKIYVIESKNGGESWKKMLLHKSDQTNTMSSSFSWWNQKALGYSFVWADAGFDYSGANYGLIGTILRTYSIPKLPKIW